MSRTANATDLFAGGRGFPAHSESFWTSVFALFLLHLASQEKPLRLWRYESSRQRPWYWRHQSTPALDLSGLRPGDLSVEPTTRGHGDFFQVLADVSVKKAGFRPDILLRLSSSDAKGDRFILLENKTTEHLQRNQMENYPALSRALSEKGVKNHVCLLMSLGADDSFCKCVEELHSDLGQGFSIVLWEDVFRSMKAAGFQPVSLPVDEWLEYTALLDDDARWE